MDGLMAEWINKVMNAWMNERMNDWMNEWLNGMDGLIKKWLDK